MLNFITKHFRKKKTYEISLPELVTISLNRHSLEELVRRIETRKEVSDIHPDSEDSQRYVTKMLSEEVEKQFSDERRPLVELVSNAIDAKPSDYEDEYQVKLSLCRKSFEVQDRGNPMTLRQLLTTLIIPFETNKDSTIDIGRFGVGFLSNLQYCLTNPNKGNVVVESSDGESTYRLSFKSSSPDIRDLTCRIDAVDGGTKGTKVSVSGVTIPKDMGNYFKEYFGFFDPQRAVATLNGRVINPPNRRKFTEYDLRVNVEVDGEEKEQKARLVISHGDLERKREEIKYYSQGIFILKNESVGGTIKIDFPPAVKVVEGRDELKIDKNYERTMDVVWDGVLDYCRANQNPKDLKALERLVLFFAAANGNHTRHNKEFRELFFPNKAYAMASDSPEYSQTLRFFGDQVDDEIYSDPHWSAKRLWYPEFLGFEDLVERETELIKKVTKGELVTPTEDSTPKLHNVGTLSDYHEYSLVQLKKFRGGNSPFLHAHNGTVYVNVSHPYFRNEGDFTSRYGLTTSLDIALGSREKQVERKLIQRGMER